MEVLALLVTGAVNLLCFFIGAKIGQAVVRGEKIETPALNPMNVVREHREKKEAEKTQERIDTILRNVENYNGTAQGQEDVPKG